MVTWSELRAWVLRWLPVGVIVIAAIAGRLAYLSHTHYTKAEAHLRAEEYDDALWEYQWAIRHYVPGWPTNGRAVTDLRALADRFRDENDRESQRRALRRLRGSLYAIRSVYQPFAETLDEVERELKELGEPIEERSGAA